MAVYEDKITTAAGYEEVSDYLWDLNERIKYYFMALDPEDNFDADAYQKYLQKGENVAILEETNKGLQSTIAKLSDDTHSQIQQFFDEIALRVSKGEVTAALNLESDSIQITGDRLKITGQDLSLTTAGDLIYRGEVIAESGDIGGWLIVGGDGQGYLGGTTDSRITVDAIESDEDLSFNDVDVHGNSDLSGADISLTGAIIETDKSTIFEDGVDAVNIDAHTYEVVCGAARVYNEVVANGQITCRTCYTSADGSTWSDARLKDDISELTNEDREKILKAARAVVYDRIDTGDHQVGFIAQDLIDADPDRIYGITSKKGEYCAVSYKTLIPFLVSEIQKQTKAIDELMRAYEQQGRDH